MNKLVLAALLLGSASASAEIKTGDHAADIDKATRSGGHFKLSSMRGKVVLVDFWASWCEPCKGEAKVLEEAWQRYRGDGVVFIGVDYHDVTSDARRFLRAHGITYPTVLDGSGKIGDRWGLSGVPETYFVDRRGRLVGEHIKGTVEKQRDALRKGIEAALGA